MEIAFKKVSFDYQAGTPFSNTALKDVTFTIPSGSFTAIIGHTGSGKSTILQHLNGLLKPTSGEVHLGDTLITKDSDMKGLKGLRKKVGIVFQFPESQLFDETIGQDIAFGPKNFGMSQEEALVLAHDKLKEVHLPDEYFDRSPFDLSGGQKRRVAIAGVLALEPEVLVLDEPTAGLDPRGAKEMMQLFYRLHTEEGLTIVLVTHQMEYVASFADHVIVLEKGQVVKEGSPEEIFSDANWLHEKQLSLPWASAFHRELLKAKDELDKETTLEDSDNSPVSQDAKSTREETSQSPLSQSDASMESSSKSPLSQSDASVESSSKRPLSQSDSSMGSLSKSPVSPSGCQLSQRLDKSLDQALDGQNEPLSHSYALTIDELADRIVLFLKEGADS
ncbi:energy-coupling factor ABC transporter ATP-binding protein [Atopobacter sp. AH10]|nr:energy-coupling factor ABC transporter ATP-binding protein [Atopobacter sp. AH10]